MPEQGRHNHIISVMLAEFIMLYLTRGIKSETGTKSGSDIAGPVDSYCPRDVWQLLANEAVYLAMQDIINFYIKQLFE